MVIDQRNAGASVTPTDGAYTLDRWYSRQTVSSKYSVQQSSVAPVGFVNSMLVTSLSAYSVGSSDVFTQSQQIEGFNVADLNWGTANAKTVTLSFWVRSSLTGTFGGALANSNADRSYPFTYTISSANTWEQKSITVTGDTSGTWLTTNGIGMRVWIGLGVGSNLSGTAGAWAGADYRSATGATSVVGTNGATFYITGVQLEVGSSATSFDFRSIGTELQLCQRYCRTLDAASGTDKSQFSGVCYTTGTTICSYTFPTMRASPTASVINATQVDVVFGNSVQTTNNTLAFSEFTPNSCQPSVTCSSLSFIVGHGAVVRSDGAAVIFSAEL
jgi:hypothetical protein